MRGLTDEERAMLTWQGDPEELEAATDQEWSIATQLVADGRGQFVWERTFYDGVRWVEHLLLRSTAIGEKALRVDALVRGLG